MSGTLIENVSDTAFWIAHYRWLESARPDALFLDPLAGRLAGDRGRQIAESMRRRTMTSWAVVMRTSIIDNFIGRALEEGVDCVLNLGGGLDTRPYRMNLPPALTWIEADYPDIIEYKERLLAAEAPRCRLSRFKCDLANETERRKLLADAGRGSKKMLVLTEGVVPYLSNDAAGALASDLRSADRAAYWIVDYLSPRLVAYRRRRTKRELRNAPLIFEPDDWFAFFKKRGWRCREIRYLADESARLKRPVPVPVFAKLIAGVQRLLPRRSRGEGFGTLAGYVLLEPCTLAS